MAVTIPVAHDFICSWCWIGLSQIRKLRDEFDVQFDWRGYELFPATEQRTDDPPPPRVETNRPRTPTRLGLAYAAEGMDRPVAKPPPNMPTDKAHQAIEYAKTEGQAVADRLVERLYEAYWLEGRVINDIDEIERLASGIVSDIPAMLLALESGRFAGLIVPFDGPAFETGVYNVPTFWIGGERFAEQPYRALCAAVAKVAPKRSICDLYANLLLPPAPATRPYVAINMISTIDGRTVFGGVNESVAGLGSKVDREIMKRLEDRFDAIMIGAGTLRATPIIRWPKDRIRIVATNSGNIDLSHPLFQDAPERAVIVAPVGTQLDAAPPLRVVRYDPTTHGLAHVLQSLKCEFGIERLLVEGGSTLNGALIREDLVDELFLTIAPRIKLGHDLPTYATGEPFDKTELPAFDLVESRVVENELYVLYRRRSAVAESSGNVGR